MVDLNWVAFVWFVSNLITGLAYLHIPYEIGQWTRGAARGTGFVVLSHMFQAVFVFGGLHHLVMLGLVDPHPASWWQTATDSAMGFVTLVSAWVMYRSRTMIRGAFQTMLAHWKEWQKND